MSGSKRATQGLRIRRRWLSLGRVCCGGVCGCDSRGGGCRGPRAGERFLQESGRNSTLSCSPKASTGTVLGKIELPHSCCQASGLSLFIPRSQSHRAAGELRGKVLETGCGTQIFLQCRGATGPWEESWRITALVVVGRLRNRREEELCSSPQGAPLLRNLCNRMG